MSAGKSLGKKRDDFFTTTFFRGNEHQDSSGPHGCGRRTARQIVGRSKKGCLQGVRESGFAQDAPDGVATATGHACNGFDWVALFVQRSNVHPFVQSETPSGGK